MSRAEAIGRMKFGSLFAGIGGFDLGLTRAGFTSTWQVEIDEFCNAVLEKHFPDVARFRDIRDCGAHNLEPVELIAGGFPCQPVSLAGRREAERDARWLWPEFRRIVEELEPGLVLIENVLGLRTAGLRTVLADLAALGFDAEWTCIGAYEFGAPHIRKRIWIVASHPDRIKLLEQPGWLGRACRPNPTLTLQALEGCAATNPDSMRRLESARRFAALRGWTEFCGWDFDPLARMDDGVSKRLDIGAARKALGNAIVPQIAEAIGRAIRTTGVCV